MATSKFLVWIILLLSDLNGELFAIPSGFYGTRYSNNYGLNSKPASKETRNYLYLNYKETYGLRFDPNKIHRRFIDPLNGGPACKPKCKPTSNSNDTTIDFNEDEPNVENNDPNNTDSNNDNSNKDPTMDTSDEESNGNKPDMENSNPSSDNNNEKDENNPSTDIDNESGGNKPTMDNNNNPNNNNKPNKHNPDMDNNNVPSTDDNAGENRPDVNNNDPNFENNDPNMGNNENPNVDENNLNMDNNDPMNGMLPPMVPTNPSDDFDMVSVSPPISSNQTPTEENGDNASPDNMPSMPETDSPMDNNESAPNSTMNNFNTRLIYSFPSLINRINATKKKNMTNIIPNNLRPPSSSLKNTLNLIKKRIKQWLSWGSDYNASLVNGQRFLNVFNVIKFENGPCTSTQEGLAEMTGTCYHDYQCAELGGISIDECADGLGVCCIFKTECGRTTNQITSYFQNPGWPGASQDRLICTVTVELQPNVKQVLLDFISLELKAPFDGDCADDQFLVSGQNLNNLIPTICGINNGQHMYVEVDNVMERKLFLSVMTIGSAARSFNIRVTQLTSLVAPNNCLQYYTDLEGWFQTFNYDDTSQFVTVRNPSYLNNLNYVICIKRQWDYCSVTYSNEAENAEYEFQLINVDADGISLLPEKQAGLELFNCNDDYISVNSIRLCGEKLNDASRIDDLNLNAIITDTTNGLNIIPVRTNGVIVGRGFRINYKQIPCVDKPEQYDSVEMSAETAIVNRLISNQNKRRFKSKLTIT